MSYNPRPVGRPKSYSNAVEMEAKIKEYFEIWEKADRPLTVVGMCCWLNITRETLSQYARGVYDDPNNYFSDTIKRAKLYIENNILEGGMSGKYVAGVAIWNLKVNHKNLSEKERQDLKAAQRARTIQQQGEPPPVEEDKTEQSVYTIDLSGLSNEELRTMATYRRILKQAASRE